jgi:hypothetical protein
MASGHSHPEMTPRDHETAEIEVPADEPAGAPATVYRVEPRLFGVASPVLLAALAGAGFVLAVALLATGHWAPGSFLFGIAIALAALLVLTASRDPHSALGRAVLSTSASVQAHTRLVSVSVSAWSRAGREVVRLHREGWLLEHELKRLLAELGGAVYRDEDERAAALKDEARALAAELDRRQAELEAALGRAHGRVAGERMSSARTAIRTRAPR